MPKLLTVCYINRVVHAKRDFNKTRIYIKDPFIKYTKHVFLICIQLIHTSIHFICLGIGIWKQYLKKNYILNFLFAYSHLN